MIIRSRSRSNASIVLICNRRVRRIGAMTTPEANKSGSARVPIGANSPVARHALNSHFALQPGDIVVYYSYPLPRRVSRGGQRKRKEKGAAESGNLGWELSTGLLNFGTRNSSSEISNGFQPLLNGVCLPFLAFCLVLARVLGPVG